MEPSDYESNDEKHELYAEALALAKKFINDTSIDVTACELHFYPEELGDHKFLEGKTVIVSVEIVYND